ncbi:MAG: hypothetical protein MUC58_00200 [Rhizobiaceae bacterium]|nr:hypothetical protein [Rhizobiaceae bacterium]
MERRGILAFEASPWRARGWAVLKWCTVGFAALGFIVAALSLLSGNTISVNGVAVEGWRGVWMVTLALGVGGFAFGLIWFLVFRAIALASERH